MSNSAVARFKIINGEWIFEKILNHLGLNEKEFTQEYGGKLSNDPNCLDAVIVSIMVDNIRRARQ